MSVYNGEEQRNKAKAAEMDAQRNATRAMHPEIEAKEKLAAAKHAEEMAESGKAAALTAAADARLAAVKNAGRRLAGAEQTGVPSDAEFAARSGLGADVKVRHVKGDTVVAPAPRPAPTAAEKANAEKATPPPA